MKNKVSVTAVALLVLISFDVAAVKRPDTAEKQKTRAACHRSEDIVRRHFAGKVVTKKLKKEAAILVVSSTGLRDEELNNRSMMMCLRHIAKRGH